MRIKPIVAEKRCKNPVKVLNKTVIQMGDDKNCMNVTLHKTIRIPDGDGKVYPLPPSLGLFGVHKVDDYRNTVPKEWLKHGGVFICMHQREAMWLKFDSVGRQKAMKVGIGKINAISGEKWNPRLSRSQNDYITSDQPWLDGIATNRNYIKQFVAMPLGSGYTVESQMTGKDEFGGIQLLTYNSKPQVTMYPTRRPPIYFPKPNPYPYPYPYPVLCQSQPVKNGFMNLRFSKESKRKSIRRPPINQSSFCCESSSFGIENFDDCDGKVYGGSQELGISSGGKMKQKIYSDKYGYNNWDQSSSSKIFIHIVNSELFEEITGEKCAESTVTRETYKMYNYPWLNIYEEHKIGIGGNKNWKKVRTLNEIDNEKYYSNVYGNNGIKFKYVPFDSNNVRDGDW